jgi:hypothetical protein
VIHYPTEVAPRCFVDQQIPEELRSLLIPILARRHGIIPKWCERVEFFWVEAQPQDNQVIAAATYVFYDYLNARIDLYPNFLTRGDLRENLIVHELFHIQLEPLANAVKDLRDFLSAQHPQCKNLFEEIIRHAEERTVSSLAHWVTSNG